MSSCIFNPFIVDFAQEKDIMKIHIVLSEKINLPALKQLLNDHSIVVVRASSMPPDMPCLGASASTYVLFGVGSHADSVARAANLSNPTEHHIRGLGTIRYSCTGLLMAEIRRVFQTIQISNGRAVVQS